MYQPQIVVVGAGIIGLSTAYALLRRGLQHVTVLEQATVDHQRSTSHGFSRLLRFEYGDDLFYTEMVRLSLNHWRNLEHTTQRVLYTQTGLLVLGNEDDHVTKASYQALSKAGFSIDYLARTQCIQRFPQFNTQPYDIITYNTEAGILHASTCLHTLKQLVLDLGGTICEHQNVTQLVHHHPQRPILLQLTSGCKIAADRVVLATGPWVHHLLGHLHLPVRLTRQYLLYFANLPLSEFGLYTFPAFIADDLYGFPIHTVGTGYGANWLKAASHTFGVPVEPDTIAPIDERHVNQVVTKLQRLLPALQQATLAHIDACMYDVSLDENFILDHVPYDPRIVFATGLTGHGFKFGLVLGELLSSLVCGTEPLVPMERFRLARFALPLQTQTSTVA